MIARRDYFARSEDQMRNKLIAEAVDIFRERLRRKVEKKEQSGRKKTPGLTLRDAFARRRAREQANQEEMQIDNEASFAACCTTMPSGAGARKKDAPEIAVEDEDEYFEEEEEEPLDPVQIQANLEAAKEKKRLQDIESKQLQMRFKEKQRLPKYRERVAQRSILPAYLMKDAIVEAIDKHSVTVISGDTGKYINITLS